MRKIPTHMLVAGSAWAGRLTSAAAGLITIRLLTEGLGTEHYAVYAILSGLQGWYMLSDMGVGVSLQNHISERRAKDKSYDDFIWAAALIALFLVFSSIVLLHFMGTYLAPRILGSFPFLSTEEKIHYFFVVGALSILMGIGSIVYRIWYAEQKGYLANIIPAVGALLTLASIWIVVHTQLTATQRLYWSLIASFVPIAGLPVIALIGKAAGCAGRRSFTRELLHHLVKRAFKFWFFGLMAAGVLQIDYLLMSQYLKPNEIVIYNLGTKVFNIAFFIYAALLAAVWPVCAEAIARNEWGRVRKYVRDYNIAGICFICLVTGGMMWMMPWLVKLLAPRQHLAIPTLFTLTLGAYFAIRVWSDTYAMALQSMSFLRPLWVIVPLQAALNIILQLALIPRYGIYGVVFGLICSFALTVAWTLPKTLHARFRENSRSDM
ncbi:MATE family efflux transporter [Geotalea sp. SG265]|uniref:MATE family efflux transporter n=1 Tax=Geotalea sp. SG265 TaxID=2922867 RepID=UPI001FB034AD|nr:MATE family efflux transporter [Geotalea sp. SG265]